MSALKSLVNSLNQLANVETTPAKRDGVIMVPTENGVLTADDAINILVSQVGQNIPDEAEARETVRALGYGATRVHELEIKVEEEFVEDDWA